MRGYISEGGKEDFYAYVSNLPANMLCWELYRKRIKMEEKRRKAIGLIEELEKGIISLINLGMLLLTNFYRLRIKISKKRRLVLMFEG